MKFLKELLNSVTEGVNHMGDREQTSYAGWKAACKKAYPGCTFRGDKDIGAAVLDGKDVGEWDGSVGSVFKKVVKEAQLNEKVKAPKQKAPRHEKLNQALLSKKGGGHHSDKTDFKRAKEKQSFRDMLKSAE